MTDYIDKFDTLPEGQNWLWWHFKRGGCFVAATLATAVIVALIIYLIIMILGSSMGAAIEAAGKQGPIVFIGIIVVLLGVWITANSVGGEIYNRMWRPCEQATK
jgi:hypothetical protein